MKSLWKKTVEEIVEGKIELKNEEFADVCIIGGGITGISTAYYLSKAGKKVIILERDGLANKTTGNTTAKITSQHGLFYRYLLVDNGKEFTKKYYLANQQAIKNIENIIKEENIKCNYKKQDAYIFTQDVRELEKIRQEVKIVHAIGGEAEYVEKIEPNLEGVQGAIKFPKQAQFNPRKYVKGLVSKILENGGEIYQNSKVHSIKKSVDDYKVYTDKGYVIAKFVVIATNYPVINIPGFYFLKMYQETSYAIAVETKEKLFQGMYINSEQPKISLRTARDGRKEVLIVCGQDHRVGAKISLKNAYKNLEKIAKSMYPDAKVLYKWSTQDCISLDKIPYIGEFSKMMKNVYVATGFKKWGMTTSNVAANIITDKILGRKNKFEDVFTSTRLEAIKNRWEFGEMLKETTNSLIINKFKIPEERLRDVKEGEGKIIEYDDEKIGVYKDKDGKLYKIKPVCTHLGCELSWNDLEKTWDCPCHGSRFDYKGRQIYSPAIKDLKIEINE